MGWAELPGHDAVDHRWSGSLDQAAGAYSVAEKAWLEAMGTCPGPVFIAAALDAANAPAKYVRMVTLSRPATAVDEKHEAFDEACRLLAMAQRPLLIAGNGARSAHREIVALAERYSLPAVATAHGKGVFPERHPLYVGILGLGQRPACPNTCASRRTSA